MAINGRRKGAKAERVASKVISKWTNREFSKTPASGGLGWKKANVAGDIVCTTEGHYCPFTFEVKSYNKIDFSHLLTPGIKNVEILDYWAQAKRDAYKVNKMPILMMRYNGLPSEFYYVVIGKSLINLVGVQSGEGYVPKKVITFHSEINHIAIIPSTEFFKIPYKEIRKLAKKHLRNGQSKRK